MRQLTRVPVVAIGAACLLACAGESKSLPTSTDDNTAVTVPSAPTNVSASGGDGRATITFSAPTSLGGANVTLYTATCTASATDTHSAARSASPITVGGLTNGVTYSCTVKAANSIGEGPASVAVSVTPGATAR